MQSEVHSVDPELPLTVLERAFLETHIAGFPVVAAGRLVGDVERLLVDERVHRVIVTDDDPLEGIITSLDQVQLVADEGSATG